MAEDFLGYDRTTSSKEILSADFATISFGDEKARLVQSVQGQYGHKVEPRFEAGSSTLYWVNGQPQGNVSMGRVVGTKGWFHEFVGADAACALFKPVTVRLDGDNLCDLDIENGSIKMEDVILQNISFSFSAGQLSISENVTMLVSKMTTST
jgi:hypothetical protein